MPLAKILVLGSLFGVSASPILAGESGLFIGVEGGYVRSSIDFDTTFDGVFGLFAHKVSLKANDSAFNGGVKIGYIISPSHRIYGAFNNNGKTEHDVSGSGVHVKGEQKSKTVVLGYGFTPSISENSKFLLDIHAGYASADATETITSGFTTIKEDIDFSGAVFGAKLGTIKNISENTELEFGVKIDRYSYREAKSKSGSTKAEQDQTDIGLFVGINYKF